MVTKSKSRNSIKFDGKFKDELKMIWSWIFFHYHQEFFFVLYLSGFKGWSKNRMNEWMRCKKKWLWLWLLPNNLNSPLIIPHCNKGNDVVLHCTKHNQDHLFHTKHRWNQWSVAGSIFENLFSQIFLFLKFSQKFSSFLKGKMRKLGEMFLQQ